MGPPVPRRDPRGASRQSAADASAAPAAPVARRRLSTWSDLVHYGRGMQPGSWRGRVIIADDFDETPAELVAAFEEGTEDGHP
ncbi:hypothetical protein Cma02nite_03840 [Cellulomonas marina]|nr:hypothetical protein Cma02nite_03840 [Cellulomonas marina]